MSEVDSVPMAGADWQRQLGDRWAAFADAKLRFDPDHLLNPGRAVFPSG